MTAVIVRTFHLCRSGRPQPAAQPTWPARLRAIAARLCLACWLTAASGCGASPAPAPAPGPANRPAAPAPKADVARLELVDATDLPVVDRATPPLDDGRVEISLPEDWVWAPRSKDYLIRAQLSPDAKYPNVTAYAEAAPEMKDASSENATELVKIFRTTLDKELAPKGLKLDEPVHAIQIGAFFGVEYVRRAKIGADSVERLFLVTVKNGRKYSLELRALQGSLSQFRPFGRAIAASMNFDPDSQAVGAPTAP